MPPVNQENVQKVVEISYEMLLQYQQKISEFSQRAEILEWLKNPEYRSQLQEQYNETVARQNNGETLFLDNSLKQQFNTLYLLNQAEENGGNLQKLSQKIQGNISLLQGRISDCGFQQEELEDIQQEIQYENITQKKKKQQERVS